jgi:hypothetical protein
VEDPAVVKPHAEPGRSRDRSLPLAQRLRQAFGIAAPLARSDGQRQLQLESELEEARRLGRWLSDDEREQIARERALLDQRFAQEQRRRRSLLLLAVCLLLPPFWPLAVGLTAYLIFPRTTRTLTIVLAVLAVVGVVLMLAALIALVVLLH